MIVTSQWIEDCLYVRGVIPLNYEYQQYNPIYYPLKSSSGIAEMKNLVIFLIIQFNF